MKIRLIIALFAIVISGTIVAFTQSKNDNQVTNLLIEKNTSQQDSIYYGCVPCCNACSVFTTDKPGECPHCGMVLEKRIYHAGSTKRGDKTPIKNGACKPPKNKKAP